MKKPAIIDTATIRDALQWEGLQAEGVAWIGDVGVIADSATIKAEYWTRLNTVSCSADRQISYIISGESRALYNLMEMTTTAGCLLIHPPGMLITPLTPHGEMARVSMLSVLPARLAHSYTASEPIVVRLSEEQKEVVKKYYELLSELATEASEGAESAMIAIADSLLAYAFGLPREKEEKESAGQNSHREIFLRFHNLLNEHGIREHRIAFYADRLAITPNYLNTIVKSESGKTIAEWVNQLLVSEAKAALSFSDMSVKAISDALSFPNSAYFCRFFKRHVGVRPSEYRVGERG